jgi:SAM-dependent methyltransferase
MNLEQSIYPNFSASAFINEVYLSLLKRPVDDSGYNYYMSEFDSGRKTPSDLVNDIMISQEFKAVNQNLFDYKIEDDPIFTKFFNNNVRNLSEVIVAHTPETLESLSTNVYSIMHHLDEYYNVHNLRFLETVNTLDFLFATGRLRLGSRLLEFGGSHLTGQIINHYFGQKCRIASADLTRSAPLDAIAVEQFTVNLESDEISSAKISEDLFDVILFCEVIEHLRNNPERLFEFISKNLRPGGYAYITTPNFYRKHQILAFNSRRAMQPVVPLSMKMRDLAGFHVREYCANEIFQYAEGAQLVLEGFYFSNCWDNPSDPIPPHELANMVFLFKKKV